MRKLKDIVKKEFLPLLSPYGFELHRSSLVIKPVNDLLRCFGFDKNHDHVFVHLFIYPMYIPTNFESVDYGWRLKGNHDSYDMFFLDDEHIEFSISEISRLMLKEKDWLLETKTVSDFYNKFLISDLKINTDKSDTALRYQETLTYTESYLYPERTCTLVDKFLEKWEKSRRKELDWMQEIKRNMLLLKEKCDSKEKVMEQFNEWKKYTASNLKIKVVE